tara:strand:+ start:4086 stop:5966 length:1881 start_codon:yes stop_codon:yes gene_type:complete
VGIVFKNNAKTTLSSAVNNSTTTIPVTEGSVFPAVNLSGAGTFFLLTLDDETNNEILKVTSCSGASGNIDLTVIRAQEGTTARAFSSGDKAELRFTSGTVDEIRSDNTVHTNIFTTSNNSTTAFTLSDEVANENDLVVFIDGVFQAHNTFSVSGTTLTLATAPASGRVVTVYSIKGSRSASNVALATMTGDNSDTTLTLPVEPINENSVQVFFDGVYQNKDSFSISGTTLTFGVAPPTGVAVEALVFTKLAINTSSILSDTDADTKVQVEESSDEDKIRFDTAGSERVVIDNLGNVGIGADPTLGALHVTSATNDIVTFENTSTGTTGAQLLLYHNSSSPADGDRVGALAFQGKDDGGNHTTYAGIRCLATDVSDGGEDGTLTFSCTKEGTFTEAMRIDSSGNVQVGASSVANCLIGNDGNLINIKSKKDGTDAIPLTFMTQASGGALAERVRITDAGTIFYGTSDNINTLDGVLIRKSSNQGQVFCSGDGSSAQETYYVYDNTNSEYEFFASYHGTVYYRNLSQLSDERKKDNIADITLGLDAIKELRPVSFDWKNNKGDNQLGFIAQEVETTSLSQLIGTYKDDNIADCKSLNQGALIPVLVKAIQEQQTIIDDLKSRIETLEG